jgi:DNA modification methylase
VSNAKPALYQDDTQVWGLIEADALLTLAKLPDACVDAVVTDPPYGIAFRDESWDGTDIHQVATSRGELLSASEAFQRWTQVWAGECLRVLRPGGHLLAFGAPRTVHRLVSGVEDAGLEVRDQLLWVFGQGMPKSRRLPGGRGTALKPAYEPILLARKPLDGSTIESIERFGTGALNIETARIGTGDRSGYWPANLILSHAPDCPPALLDNPEADRARSRLFYCAKATRAEREEGCGQLPARPVKIFNGKHHPARVRHNTHPTVKPISLMRWLVRLVTPESGLVLDPFCGSGSTGAATVLERRAFLGIEREGEYIDIACARLTHWAHQATKESS